MVRIPYRSRVIDIGHPQSAPDDKEVVIDNVLPFLWMPVGIWMGIDLGWGWVAVASGVIWLYYARGLLSSVRALHRQRHTENLIGRS